MEPVRRRVKVAPHRAMKPSAARQPFSLFFQYKGAIGPIQKNEVHSLYGLSNALKPACSKCRPAVSASLIPFSAITTKEMQSVSDHSLSVRAR